MKIKIIAFVLFTSFLWAQQTLIPYRKGSLWGLCDKKSNMVLNPVFDSIKDMDYVQLFRVHQNGNEGVAYQGKIVIAPSATFTYYERESIFIVEQNKKDPQSGYTAVYNLNGQKVIQEPISDITITHSSKPTDPVVVVVTGGNKNSGVFVYDKSKQKIVQWLYKDKNAYFACKFKPSDKAIHIYFHDEKTDKSFYYKANYSSTLKKYALAPDTQAQVEDMNSNQEVVEQREDKYGFYEVKNNYAERIYAFATKKGKTRLLRTDRRNHDSTFKHDSIFFDIPETDIKIRKFIQGNGYELSQYDTSPNNVSDKEKVDTIFTYYNYLTYKKNNKLGLILGAKVWEAKYDSIRYFRAESELKPYFLVSIKNDQGIAKWGVIAAENQIILPCVYDEITVN
ncbi:MAG: WG repeat-containing protein, partial [Flavobacterium sp.]